MTIADDSVGVANNANNRSNTRYGLARDLNSSALYIADYYNYRVISYLSSASSDTLVAQNNTAGKGNTQLNYSVGLYYEPLSNILVIANHISHNIVRWVLGGTSWTLLAGNINGIIGNSLTQLYYPTDMIFDPMGNRYVADRDNHRIQLYMNGQSEGITNVKITDVAGTNVTLLWRSWSIRLDNQLILYVADSNNHRIQKFLRYQI